MFYLGVNFNSFFLSFKSYDPLSGKSSFAGLSVFRQVFYDLGHRYVFRAALRNSLIAYVSTTLLGMSLALAFSYYIFKKRFGLESVQGDVIHAVDYSEHCHDHRIHSLYGMGDSRFRTKGFSRQNYGTSH